ncbi:Uncharacterised protein [Vibrio cholerae]|nr:Uncharacterised protein [Vibrio cholerae]CSI68257.1 Uncharacterised protein [Vibrio cholerae]CSI76744.1 Uncharacterised protein [Vibrio cholerae]
MRCNIRPLLMRDGCHRLASVNQFFAHPDARCECHWHHQSQ